MISRLKKKSDTEYVMLERKPFYSKHLLPHTSRYSRIENVPSELHNYQVVYIKNNVVYRRLFFNKFNYADKAFVAMSNKLIKADEPIWDISKYVMEDGRPILRKEGFKKWILRKTNWMRSLKN